MNIQITLSVEEINAVLQILGQTPTSTGVFPLLMKIKNQAETQLPPVANNTTTATEP